MRQCMINIGSQVYACINGIWTLAIIIGIEEPDGFYAKRFKYRLRRVSDGILLVSKHSSALRTASN